MKSERRRGHAAWCSGPVSPVDLDVCSPDCELCKRWLDAECECEARGWDGRKDCTRDYRRGGRQHKSEWDEGGNHLVCVNCGLEGT